MNETKTTTRPYDGDKGARAATLGRRSMTISAIVGVAGLLTALTRTAVIATGDAALLQPGKAQVGDPGWVGLYAYLVVVGLLVTGVAIVGFVFRVMWAWRLATNGAALELPARRGPGWAIGSWFIPVGNLVLPYQSIADAGPQALRPMVLRWWCIEIGAVLTGYFATVGNGATKNATALLVFAGLGAVSAGLSIAQAFVGIPMVSALEGAQSELATTRR